MKKISKRGGWPKRERETILTRVSPEVAEFLRSAASKQPRSVSALVELALQAVCEASKLADPKVGALDGNSPDELAEDVAMSLASALAALGLLPSSVGDGIAWRRAENARRLIELTGGKKQTRGAR